MQPLKRIAQCATCCVLTLVFQANVFAQTPAPDSNKETVAGNVLPESAITIAELPDSPGATQAQPSGQSNNSTSPASSSAPASQSSSQGSQNGDQQDQKLQHPVGTAAAEAPKVNGITAAQPAGVAIAPAKQRRVRVIVLKVGAILGAGAALGAVVALSRGTPSKPPGAH